MSTEHGFSFWHQHGQFWHGWAVQRRSARQSLYSDDWSITNLTLWLLADVQAGRKNPTEGHVLLDEAPHSTKNAGFRPSFIASGPRVVATSAPQLSEAELSLHRALWRGSATSLAGLWRDRGRSIETRDVRAVTHDTFIEGPETPYLRLFKDVGAGGVTELLACDRNVFDTPQCRLRPFGLGPTLMKLPDYSIAAVVGLFEVNWIARTEVGLAPRYAC